MRDAVELLLQLSAIGFFVQAARYLLEPSDPD